MPLSKDNLEIMIQPGRYSNASDYARDLIRRDQEHNDKIAHMQILVTEAIESGVSNKSMDEVLTQARKMSGVS